MSSRKNKNLPDFMTKGFMKCVTVFFVVFVIVFAVFRYADKPYKKISSKISGEKLETVTGICESVGKDGYLKDEAYVLSVGDKKISVFEKANTEDFNDKIADVEALKGEEITVVYADVDVAGGKGAIEISKGEEVIISRSAVGKHIEKRLSLKEKVLAIYLFIGVLAALIWALKDDVRALIRMKKRDRQRKKAKENKEAIERAARKNEARKEAAKTHNEVEKELKKEIKDEIIDEKKSLEEEF